MTLYNERGEFIVGGELKISTKKGRQIPNQRKLPRPPVAMCAARDLHLTGYPLRRCRSLSSDYNCAGMVFANRRTTIDSLDTGMILEDDEYRNIHSRDQVEVGDVVVYKDDRGEVSHVGLVSNIGVDIRTAQIEINVLSQFGADGEYIHPISDVEHVFGSRIEFWSDRVL